jgi:hypothetical protein
MDREFLGDRKKALEDSFFAKENQKLLDKMRAEQHKKEAKAGLAEVAGISDESVLEKLASMGIEPDTWAALSLVPLVEVAWADGSLDPKERRAVLSAAEANGVEPGSASAALLESWLHQRPGPELISAWGEYMVVVCAGLEEGQRKTLRREIVGRARSVAEAAGGILGLLNRISSEEEAVLAELEKPFAGREGSGRGSRSR